MLRRFVRWFDHRLSDAYGIYIFNDSPECILRLQDAHARHDMDFGNLTIQKGDSVLGIHLWSEHLPPISQPYSGDSIGTSLNPPDKLPASKDFTWAVTTQRRFVGSLRLAAAYAKASSAHKEYKAIFAATSLFSPEKSQSGAHPMERLGFKIIPYHSALGSFGNFWENFYALTLIWAYNPASVQRRNFWELKRTEMWMEFDEFMTRYGARFKSSLL